MSISRLSVSNPTLVNLIMIVIAVTGGITVLTMVREMFPEFRPNKLLVTTVHPGVAPEEIEKGITVKIEEAIRDVDGVERVESTVTEGLSLTTATLATGVKNPDAVLRDVKAEVDAIEDLPADAYKSQITKLVPKLPVIAVALYGPGDEKARKLAARRLREDLLRLPGVSEVNLGGAREDEISVEIRPEKLLEYDVTFDDVARAIRESNLDVSGGQLEGLRALVSVRTLGETQRGVDLETLVVRSLADGRKIMLRDVAVVRDDFVDVDSAGYYNGHPMVSCVVYKTADQDVLQISQLVKAYVAGKRGQPFDAYGYERAAAQPWYWRPFALGSAFLVRQLNGALGRPDPQLVYESSRQEPFDHGFQVDVHTDLARFVEGRIELMTDNGIQGLFLVLLMLVLFLEWRVAFWAAVGLPVTFLGTFVLMWFFGQSINLISLMGLIIVLGIDVDEAIVMGENIYRHMEAGLAPPEAAVRGAEELFWPVVVMTGTTIGAFVPLLFISGQIGEFLRVLPMVVIAAMLVSMFDALVILPAHLASIPDRRRGRARAEPVGRAAPAGAAARVRGGLTRIMNMVSRQLDRFIQGPYDRFIHFALKHRYATLCTGIASLLVVAGMFQGGIVRTTWVQKMDSETLVASVELPIGVPTEQTERVLLQMSEFTASLPEVVNVQMFSGATIDIAGEGAVGAHRGTHLGQLIVELQESSRRQRSSDELLTWLRAESARVSGVNAITWMALNGGPAGRAVEIQLSGSDFAATRHAALRLKEHLETYQGVVDVDDNLNDGQREIRLKLRETARPIGISVAGLGNEVRGAFYGREAKRFTRDREDVRIMVRYPEQYRRNIYHLESMWIPAPGAAEHRPWIPLGEVAALEEDVGYTSISRTRQQRSVTVYADVVEGQGNSTEIVANAQKWFEQKILPEQPGLHFEIQGAGLEQQKALQSLSVAFPIALLIIYMMLAGLFRSYLQPLVVMIAIPFGVQGAFLGHWITGHDITIMSIIGLVALNGIVVNDSLVLLDFINALERQGMRPYDACAAASKLRLRAILLTTLTTVSGLTPLMFEQSFQAKFLIPLVVTLSFGLIFATLLTLCLVPALNLVLVDLTRRRSVS